MIVKDFDYVRGNTATQPQRKYDDIKKDNKKKLDEANRKRNKRLKEEKIKKRNAALQIALVVLVLGVLTIWRDTKVYSLQKQVSAVNSEIKTLNSENEALRVELLKNASLKNIEANANKKLKMVLPIDAEKIEVNLSNNYLPGLED